MKYIILFAITLGSFCASAQDAEKDWRLTADTNRIFTLVQNRAVFPEGDDSLRSFIHNHIVYPDSAKRNKVEGRVIVGMVIERNGHISNITIKKNVSPDLDAEAMRVIGLLPNFEPGNNQHFPLRVNYIIPVEFKLPK